ncbi:MAG TPA: prepilin-type N-terminal cleavage/methylation domain-containing protein [Pseudomonadales bacterium]|nr:prepilin-type N-terminal cleavage/methylation domain-containing protein [Pseudomonadales bacterium]
MKTTIQPKSSGAVAFTLIELLTVIAIIAILAAILLPVLSTATTHAKKTKAATEIAQIRSGIEQYESQYTRMPVSAAVQSSGLPNITYGGIYKNKAGTTWPTGNFFQAGNTNGSYISSNSDVIAILMDFTNYPNGGPTVNANHQKNPQGTKFLNATIAPSTNSPGIGPDLNFRDPWGNLYLITMDLNEDDKTEDPFYKLPAVSSSTGTSGSPGLVSLMAQPTSPGGDGNYFSPGNVMVWSMGPDGPINSSPSSFDATLPANNGANKQHILSWTQ